MEKEEMDDEEVCDGGFVSEQQQAGETDECTQEDNTVHLNSQETSVIDPGTGDVESCESMEAKEDAEEVSEGFEQDLDHENPQLINQEEDEAAKEQQMNGESGWRALGGGRRCKLRSGSSLFEQSFQKGSIPSSGSRHKQTRRRNHHHHQQSRSRRRTGKQLFFAFREMLSDSLSVWCISCVHMLIEIIVTLTHNCGVGVEMGVLKLYNCGKQIVVKITDLPGMKADFSRVLKRMKCAGADLLDKTMRTLKWIKSAVSSCLRLFCALVIFSFQWVKGLLLRVGGERGKRYWMAFLESRVWKRLASVLERVRSWFRKYRNTPSSPSSPSRAARGEPSQELERLLALAEVPEGELDPFTVLGVEVHATETELKKAYRQLAVQVHPDKNKHPRAGEAFKVLRAAWDIVSNPETRREYELKRMAATELSKSMNEFLTKLQDDLKEAMNTMMCTKCEGKHKRFEMDRDPAEARFCAECSRCHSAEEGDLWAESSMLGLRITYFACMEGKVYDITGERTFLSVYFCLNSRLRRTFKIVLLHEKYFASTS
ncbi:dnaJ homolog subfamily C member 14-like [Poecilia latipinna]|uniref:dnaJ homolog subfamily C member 14-like n=1 Tax=Poecilia latipinna TaxID=48699 RepID=UPI00072E599D|nr:PREDICTED: dnaJ homolog subfamily C member 14-like [Poecilia latipinna]XP_014876992.1 PREDICTED: dnaJ homolog subfamily C member 14-like [Poecilia latipinna]